MIQKHLILILLFTIGCASTIAEDIKTITDNYETVDFDDGIDLEESKIVAQKQLIKNNVVDIYELTEPQITEDVEDLPNSENFWFVFFEEKKPSSIPFIFMVIVNKENGKIKFADDYDEGNKWILEAALLR